MRKTKFRAWDTYNEAWAVALVVVGIIFVATMIIVLGQLTKATVDSKANMYDLNCLTEPVEKPLTECRE